MRRHARFPRWSWMILCALCVLAAPHVEAQLFENLEAFGNRLDAGDPTVRATGAREGPKGIATGDLDGNGSPDLALSNLDGTVTVYLNAGDGSFGAPVHLATGAQTLRGITIADLTGDRVPDIATAAPFEGVVFIFVSRGGGVFDPPLALEAWPGARNLAAGDFDGDGVPDLAVAGPGSGLRHYRGAGPGAFEAPQEFDELAAGDQGNNDPSIGDGESLFGDDFPKPVYSLRVFRPRGQDRDELAITHARSDWLWTLGAAPARALEISGRVLLDSVPGFEGVYSLDVGPVTSRDGAPDLVTAHRNAGTVAVRRGAGPGRFQDEIFQEIHVPGAPRAVRMVDLDGDGWNDLVVVLRNLDAIRTYRNEAGRFVPELRMPVGRSPRDAVVADFNADGQPDLAVINRISSDVSVLTAYPERVGFAALDQLYLIDGEIAALGVSDTDKDGRDDVVQVHRASGDWSVRLSGPEGRLAPPEFRPTGTFPDAQAIVDVNNDGITDSVTSTLGRNRRGTLSVQLGDGQGGFSEPRIYELPPSLEARLSGLGVADFDQDGHIDVAAAMDDCRLAMWKGDGDGGFRFTGAFFFAYEAMSTTFATADFDQDGDIDLAAASWGGTIVVVQNDGTLLANPSRARLSTYPYDGFFGNAMKAADVNLDGDPDLVLGTDVGLSVFLGAEGITFGRRSVLSEYSTSSLAFGDFDGDGLKDIAVSCAVQSCVRVFTRDGSGRYGLALVVDVPSGQYLATGDLDGDGKDDLVGSGDVLWTALSSRRARLGPPPVLEGEREKATHPVLNEILAVNNDLPLAVDDGKKPDWVEIYSSQAASLSGWRLRLTEPGGAVEEFTFPAGASIGGSPETSHLLVFFSSRERSPFHTGFKLPGDGARLELLDPSGQSVDVVEYPAQRENISYSRYEDGLREFVFDPLPSPGRANADNGSVPPILRLEEVRPERSAFGAPLEVLEAGAGLRFFASGTDDVGIWSASLLYQQIGRQDRAVHRVILYDDGQHEDGGVQDGLFSGVIAERFPASVEIEFYLEAYDWNGNVVTVPEDAFLSSEGFGRNVFRVAAGVDLPPLEISEVVPLVSDGPDQLEIRNCAAETVSLAGMSIGERFPDDRDWFHFPADLALAPGEVAVVICDGDPEDGPLHAPFRLSSGGGRLVLAGRGPAGAPAIIDAVDYPAVERDIAWARTSCGGAWAMAQPTLGRPNGATAGRGDVDRSGTVNLSDAVEILDYLFRRRALSCPGAADANSDGRTNLTDAVFLLVHLFSGGAAPGDGLVACDGE